jgi:hypothetical protein
MTTDDDENIGPKNVPLKKGACDDQMWNPGLFDGIMNILATKRHKIKFNVHVFLSHTFMLSKTSF